MDEQILKSLNDILKSVENIELFCSSRPKEFKTFCEDTCFRILKISPNIQITSARRIVNTRNYLIHGYDSLREDLIWAIVINHLPLLKSEVTKLIESSQEVR